MIRTILKTSFSLLHLLSCLLLIMEKRQPPFHTCIHCGHHVPTIPSLPKQAQRRLLVHPWARRLSWRRLLFLLG
ncbi:MAG: hypothetical protein R3E79_31715 [Caldilineaceae bacterium]